MTHYQLAELNIARLKAPIDDPSVKDFVDNIARINALAEASQGFVWRLKDEDDNALAINPFDDPRMIINLSVWESIENLFTFTYSSEHVDFFRRRAEWFGKLEFIGMVMWWIPAGEWPTAEEAKAKLDYLNEHGPTPHAFTFKKRFTVEELLATVVA